MTAAMVPIVASRWLSVSCSRRKASCCCICSSWLEKSGRGAAADSGGADGSRGSLTHRGYRRIAGTGLKCSNDGGEGACFSPQQIRLPCLGTSENLRLVV